MADNRTEVIINKDEIVWATLSQDTSTGRNLIVKFKDTVDLFFIQEELCGNFWKLVKGLGMKTGEQQEDSIKIDVVDPDNPGKFKTIGEIKA